VFATQRLDGSIHLPNHKRGSPHVPSVVWAFTFSTGHNAVVDHVPSTMALLQNATSANSACAPKHKTGAQFGLINNLTHAHMHC